MIKLYQDREWLYNEHITSKKPQCQIEKEQGWGRGVLFYWFKKFNIKSISRGESYHLSNGNHIGLFSKVIKFLGGLLLGDGHLDAGSKYSACYQHSSKHKGYVEYVSNIFNSFGIKQCGNILKRSSKTFGNISYSYTSLSYSELLLLQKKWYRLYNPKTDPENWPHKLIKIVPRNLELTPTTCLYWYIDDGCLCHSKSKKTTHYSNYITLSTQGFPITDVDFLVTKLNQLEFEATRQLASNVITIHTSSTPAFLDYIGHCPIDCYQYKWELKK